MIERYSNASAACQERNEEMNMNEMKKTFGSLYQEEALRGPTFTR
jgi:hypothetical protein